MRILLDTNILIYREDDHILSANMQRLLSILHEMGAALLIHPKSIEDIKKDIDRKRQEIMLSKIRTYRFLETPPNPKGDLRYLNTIESRIEDHDLVDIAILYAVYKDAVDFLLTEDKRIHRKARRFGIEDRVLLINDALQIFEGYIQKKPVLAPAALREQYAYNLDLRDAIFDSLKKDYPEFEQWFKKISREGRKCWVYYREDDSIGALLIYKLENESIDSEPPLPKMKRLKLCTFKVTHVGHRIGELLIKLSTNIAINNNLSEMYLTRFADEDDRLVELISEYGFREVARSKRGEDVFLKKVRADQAETRNLSPLEIATRFYPSFYDGPIVRKFIVPIRPEYHNRLFTSFEERQTTLFEYAGKLIVEGNTIKKAYICHSKLRKMGKGDILLFYLSEQKKLTSVGTVEIVHTRVVSSVDIIRLVEKRTVYSKDEIEQIAKKSCMVILFRHHFHLYNPLPLRRLRLMGILTGPPQSIMQVPEEAYEKIKLKGGIDERFTIH